MLKKKDNKMKNKRYDEIDHKEIKTIEDINKIVENEVKLDKERNDELKRGMATATTMSLFSKIIIILMVLFMVSLFSFVGRELFKFFIIPALGNQMMCEQKKVVNNLKEQIKERDKQQTETSE